jgi:hypothetical protein
MQASKSAARTGSTRFTFSTIAATAAAVLLLVAPTPASAHPGAGNLGIGLGLGAPTGVSLEVGAGAWSSFELGLGLDLFDERGGYGHLVYKASIADLARGPTVRVPLYLGVGAYLYDHERSFEDDTELGVRIPIGVNFDFQRSPLQFFAELALGIPLDDADNDEYERDTWLGGYVGFRLWF